MANIFEAMSSMLESKKDDKPKRKDEKWKIEPSTSKGTDRYDKPNLFENILIKRDPETNITKGHKSAIDNFAKNLSKFSFNKNLVDKCSDSDQNKSEISALNKSNDDHDSDDEDESDLDDFMVVDEASSSDEDDSSDNDQIRKDRSENIFKEELTTSTPDINNTRKKEQTELSASPITKTIHKTGSQEMNASNETVYSDVTSDESGEIHSDDNYLDLSDEENSFMKRVKLVKEPKVVPTKVTYEELLSKELKLRKLKSQPIKKNPNTQTRSKRGGPGKPKIPQIEFIERFITEQRHFASKQQKNQDAFSSCTSSMDKEKLDSLRIEMDGAERKISIVNDDDKSSELCNSTTEKLNTAYAKDNSKEIDKSSKNGSTNTNSDDEETYPSMSLDGLIVVDEAGCESSENEESEEGQFEVIDSCLDVEEEEEKISSPVSDKDSAIENNAAISKDQEEVLNKDVSSNSRNSEDLEDDSSDSFSNAMVIDEVTSPEVEDSAKQASDKEPGSALTNENKISQELKEVSIEEENNDDIVQPDHLRSPEDKDTNETPTSIDVNDKSEKKGEKSILEEDPGNTFAYEKKISQELKDASYEENVVQQDSIKSPGNTDTNKSPTSIDVNDKSEEEREKSILEGTESCKSENICASYVTDIQKQNLERMKDVDSSFIDNNDTVDSTFSYSENENNSESDESKSLIIDESNIQPEEISAIPLDNKIEENADKPKNVPNLVDSDCLSLTTEQRTSLQTMAVCEETVSEETNKSCKPTLETADSSPKNSKDPKRRRSLECQTDISPSTSLSHKKDSSSGTTKVRSLVLEEGIPATKLDTSLEKYLLGKTKASSKTKNTWQPAPGVYTERAKLESLYTIVKVDLTQNKKVTKVKKTSNQEKADDLKSESKTDYSINSVTESTGTDLQEKVQHNIGEDPDNEPTQAITQTLSIRSQPVVSSLDKTFRTSSESAVTSCTSVTDNLLCNPVSAAIGPTTTPSSAIALTSLTSDTLTSSVCDVRSCAINILTSSNNDSSLGGANSIGEKTSSPNATVQSSLPTSVSSSPECVRKESAETTMISSCEEFHSSNMCLTPPSNSITVLPSSMNSSSKGLITLETRTVKFSPDGRYTKSLVSVSNVNSSSTNTVKPDKVVYVSPSGQNQSVNPTHAPTSLVTHSGSSKPCIILNSDQSTTPRENSVKILSAKNTLPVTPLQKYMHSLISTSKTGPNPSTKSQPESSVKYLITLKKCDKNGSEADSQPETILTSDLVQSLTKIGTTSVVNCQKLVISPAKTIKVIPNQPKSPTPQPMVDIQTIDPASDVSNHLKDLAKSKNIIKETSNLIPPPPLIKCPNIRPQEQSTDPLLATESAPSLPNMDYPQPIVMSSSLMKYHDITGISAKDSSQQDPININSSNLQADENPFKILKVSDSVIDGVPKKKKRAPKKPKVPKSVQYIYSYPVDYNKSQEIGENKQKETPKASKRSRKRDALSVNLTSGMTNRELYMPPKDKLDNFRGRFLVGKVNGAFICFKCKSKFSEVKYFRWHLWYHIHLHSDFCPTCDSQDPLGECTTTDSLLQTVAGLENEQIFYVMTKGENANSFETYKSLSEVASDIYPSEKVNNQLLLSETVNLTTQEESDAKYEVDPVGDTEDLEPESVNHNNNALGDIANDESDNFMGLKILNTFSLSDVDTGLPLDSNPSQSTLNENLAASIPASTNSLETNTSRLTSQVRTDGICGSFYKCSFCDFSTLFPSEFKNHVYGNHMTSSIYKCYYCDFSTYSAGIYISHYGDHVNSVKEDCVFTCTFPGCEDKVSRLEQHLKHVESHEDWRPLCCQCSMEFPCLKSLSEHYKKNLVSLFSCQYCDAKAVDKNTYLQHVSQIHSLKARMVMVRKTLICHVTEKSQSLNKVSPSKHPPQTKFLSQSSDVCFSTFICQKCSFVCNDKSEFLNHKKIHSFVETDVGLVFTCPSCPAAFKTLNNLWEHLQYHDEVIEFNVYKCPQDDFTTNDLEKGTLFCRQLHHEIHELVQQSVITYKNSIHHCKLCGIKVKERNIFLRHLLIHGKDGEKVAQSLKPLADFDISACIKPTLAVRPSLILPVKPVSKSPKTPSPKKVPLTQQQRRIARDEPISAYGEVEERQPMSEELLKLKNKLNKPVANPVNMVVQASPTYKYNAQILDQKLKVLYTHKSGFFVCLICQSLFRVKNLLSNHIVEHLEMPYQCCKCGFQNTSYDAAISHALIAHNMENINIIYSEAINDKISKMTQSLNSKSTNISQTARDEFSKRVNMLRQHKTFQSSAKTKAKVLTSSVPSCTEVSPNFKDAEEHRMEKACRSMSAKESEKMAFLQETETNDALMKLCKRGAESNWCRICSKPFSRSSLADIFIKEHILVTHLKYKPYKCQNCDFSAFSWKSFSIHSRTIHAGVSIFIEERNIGSLVDSYMKAENIVVEDYSDDQEGADNLNEDFGVEKSPIKFSKQPTSSSYVCEHCNTKFDCPFKMLRHKKLAHSKTSSNTARKSTTPAAVQQLLRQSSETSPSVLCARKSTTKAANNRQPKSATQCARKSTAGKRRQSHPGTVVPTVENIPDVPKFVCPKCDFVTEKRKRAMIYHFKKHGFECFVECNNCQAKYTSMRLLLKHFELIHKGKELHPNYLPIESYFQPITKEEISAMKANKQNTSKAVPNVVKPTKSIPPFKCVFCDLEEIKEEFMRYHLYIHLDYKPFKCDQCTKAFSDPFQQKQHINGDHTQKAKGIFDKIHIYETKVSEILIDCRRAVQKQQSCRPWDLEAVQNQLLEDFMIPVNWEKEKDNEIEEENVRIKEEQDIKPGEYLVTLASQSDSLVTNNSYSDGSFSYDSELPDLDVDIKPTIETTKSLADCVALKRKSNSSDKSCSPNKHPKVIHRKTDSKKKNLIESVFGVLGKEAKKKPKAAKRSLDSETDITASKKPKYSGEFDAEVILCYYCSFMSESIAAVISHTHDVHLGGRRKNSAVGMLWVDTVTGGTYDFEGHIFSNGFDTNITIEFPYLCGTCNFRSVELNDIYVHEQMQHLDLKSSTAFVIKKPLVASSGRGRSSVSYDETTRRKPNRINSDKTKPAARKDKIPATASKVSSLASSKTELDSSSSLDTSTSSKNTDCESSSLQYHCYRCNTICHTEYNYRQHLASHESFKCLVPDLARNPQLKCEICSYRAQDASKFTKHMIGHNGPAVMFLCGYCGFKATSTRAIKLHHHKRHENQSFDITKFVDRKSLYKNHSLIVDLDPQVKLENIMEMSQERFSCILNTSGNVSFDS